MGVRRAVEMATAAISDAAENDPAKQFPIYTLGPLIHNPQVLDALSKQGVKVLDTPCQIHAGAAVIIRAHGVSPGVEQTLVEQGARIIDATCPRVKANQNTAFALAEKGYTIFLAGEKDHAEIQGIYGYCLAGHAKQDKNFIIVGNSNDADRRASEFVKKLKDFPQKTALIGQTTISEDEYCSIAQAIKNHFPDLEVKNTICDATRDRQNALRELCSAVDAVIIAGGKESANTRRLLSIARDCGRDAWLAETAVDLPTELLLWKAATTEKKIGLSAGASTPDSVIDEIEQALL